MPTFWHWYCSHCGWITRDEPEWAWADAAAKHHRKTEHPDDIWPPYATYVSAFGGPVALDLAFLRKGNA